MRQQIPPLYSQEGNPDPIVYALLHVPGEYQAWFITELEGDMAFGWVIDHDEGELSYVPLSGGENEYHFLALHDPSPRSSVRYDPAFTARPLEAAKAYYKALREREQRTGESG